VLLCLRCVRVCVSEGEEEENRVCCGELVRVSVCGVDGDEDEDDLRRCEAPSIPFSSFSCLSVFICVCVCDRITQMRNTNRHNHNTLTHSRNHELSIYRVSSLWAVAMVASHTHIRTHTHTLLRTHSHSRVIYIHTV
jgi:hypothetical protein